jgi:hypothetical protein
MERRMSQPKTAFVLLVVFFAGCAAERILVVPPARAGTSPQRWEYACRDARSDEKTTNMANEMGQQGWEMAAASTFTIAGSSDGMTWCFKRPLP